ncbi:flavin reductase family protein [Cytobacillus purgationiresistens]|uniref:Flavin reductase (DIM6/NTAB) family NADH-FMN oxidoreductase RutF n=1 Tax=Cytobacillus purgationiresistens TaxID=863449 RepID=A0ABU0ACT8_9BACI|nr:flavin reductase family protein [Cytobacillus purgationiresistens]MDQ0269063.1 flavin reductase (DIM6/NTAB) family NADH-FMN oxidoreductase RutF [Cytobacillus purgationiresistens]
MASIDPEALTERENYKLLTGSIIPRPIAFVTSQSEEGIINAAPFSFFNIVSSNPPMVSLSIARKQEKMKDTARNITALKEFVVHIVDNENVRKINETAASLPPEQSELDIAELNSIPSEVISVPGIKEAKIRMECILEQSLELYGNTDLLIGKVVRFHIEDEILENGKIDAQGLGAVSRLAGHNYARIGEIFEIVRPK